VTRTEDTEGQGPDWASHATRWLETLVELIRDRSVKPILTAVRAIIVGLTAGIVGIVVVVCVIIALMRVLDVAVFSGRVWATDLLFGGILLGGGVFLLRQARPRGDNNVGR
jgi:threonine/homoserine/homoserine lactone efflux protein